VPAKAFPRLSPATINTTAIQHGLVWLTANKLYEQAHKLTFIRIINTIISMRLKYLGYSFSRDSNCGKTRDFVFGQSFAQAP
jgi:hypothetical protein